MTDKAGYYERRRQQALTPGDEIRSRLSALEAKLTRRKKLSQDEAVELLMDLDIVHDRLAGFTKNEYPAESVRFEAVQQMVLRQAASLLRATGGRDAFQDVRKTSAADPSRMWWSLDQIVEDRRKARLRKMGIGTAIATAVIAILTGLYMAFLRPDEALRETVSHTYMAEDLIRQADYPGAIQEIDIALSYTPDELELIVLKGVLLEQLEKPDEAELIYEQAREVSESEEEFLTERALSYLQVEQPEASIADAEALLAINPESPMGYLTLASGYQDLNDYENALYAYETAAELANEQGDITLEATIRVRLADLIQMEPLPFTTSTPEAE